MVQSGRAQAIAKVESRSRAPSNKIALNRPSRVWSDIRRMAMPDCTIEDDHRAAFSAAQDFARVFRSCVRQTIARKISPAVRCGHKARRPILFPERIDHENESK